MSATMDNRPSPLRTMLPSLCLFAGLTLAVVAGLPALNELRENSFMLLLVGLGTVVGIFLAYSYAAAFLDCALNSAIAGERRFVAWPRYDMGLILGSALAWMVAFLAGPIIPACAAIYYWIRCGDPVLVDRLILNELILVAAGYCILARFAMSQSDRLRDASPTSVGEFVEKLGRGAVLIALVGGIVVLVHGRLAINALTIMRNNVPQSVMLLFFCWLSLLATGTFLFRLMGVWCHCADSREPKSTS